MTPDNDDGAVTSNPAAQQTEITRVDSNQPAIRYLWMPTFIYWMGIFMFISNLIRDIFLAWSQP